MIIAMVDLLKCNSRGKSPPLSHVDTIRLIQLIPVGDRYCSRRALR
jgi:hypothetical protein